MTLADPVLTQLGKVVSVYEVQAGTSLTVATSAGLTFLTVEDLDDFADEGGSLRLQQIDDIEQTTDPLDYVSLDRDLGRIYLAAAWDSVERGDYAIGDQVWIDPISSERRADVALDGERDQTVAARIPYGLTTNFAVGVRPVDEGEWVRVTVDDYAYAVVDGVGEFATTDPASIIITDPDTGEPIGGVGGDAAFETVTADEIISPSVPKRNPDPLLFYIDPVVGDDANDGTAFLPAIDSFERVGASNGGLGTADSGHAWTTLQNQGPNLDVGVATPGAARVRFNAASQNTQSRLNFSPLDLELSSVINFGGISGAGSYNVGLAGRMIDGQNWIGALGSIASTGVLTLTIYERNSGNYSALATAVTIESGFTGATIALVDWNLRVQIQTNPDGGTDIRAKLWRTTDVEPSDWQIAGLSSVTALQNPGFAGVVSYTGGSFSGAQNGFWRNFSAAVIDGAANVIPTDEGGVGPFRTISRAIEDLGDWNDGDVRLVLTGDFDESVYVLGLAGGGRLFFAGGGTTNIYGVFKFYGVTHYVEVRDLTVQDVGDVGVSSSFEIRTSRHVEIVNVKFQTNSQHTYNVQAIEGADVRVVGCQLSGATSYCVQVAEESTAFLQDNSGSATNGSYRSAYSIIFQDGGKPTGATATSFGGQIFGTTSSNSGGTAPPTSNKVTKTFSPNGSRTWRPDWGWREDNDETYQGEYAGSGGLSRGAAFYGTKLNVSGKTADSGKIFVKRLSSGGASQDQGIYLCSHDLGSQPSNDTTKPAIKDGPTKLGTLAWGEGKWFDLPKSWVQSMLDGTGGRRGFMLYNDSASPYVIAAGKGNGGDVWKVKFTYH